MAQLQLESILTTGRAYGLHKPPPIIPNVLLVDQESQPTFNMQ